MTARRRRVTLTVTVSLAPGVTKAQGAKELRTRVNHSCGFFEHIDERDVRVSKIS